jgi:hypothetical protein
MNYCTRCGHPAGDAAASCISCGAPLATGKDEGWADVPTAPQPGGAARIFGDRPLEPTGNVRIIGGPTAGGEFPASYGAAFPGPATAGGEAPAGYGGGPFPGPATPDGEAPGGEVPAGHGARAFPGPGAPGGEVPASYSGPAFPAPGTPDGEPEPGRDPGEDTVAWLPGFTAEAPAPVLALRPPARPVRADPPPPRRPLILPPPAAAGGPADDDDFYLGDPAVRQPPEPPGQVPAWLKIAVVLVVLAGGLGAWYYFGSPRPSASGRPASSAARAARTPRPQATQPSPGHSSRPAGRSRPAGTPPGSKPVALGPGVAGQSTAAGAAAFLTQYFAAINDHDYQAFSSLFEPGASPVQSGAVFRSGYRSSRDSGGRLVALGQTTGGEWAASLTFDSHQDPASSATRTACTTWGVTFYLVPVGNSYLIGPPPPGYQASARPCG